MVQKWQSFENWNDWLCSSQQAFSHKCPWHLCVSVDFPWVWPRTRCVCFALQNQGQAETHRVTTLSNHELLTRLATSRSWLNPFTSLIRPPPSTLNGTALNHPSKRLVSPFHLHQEVVTLTGSPMKSTNCPGRRKKLGFVWRMHAHRTSLVWRLSTTTLRSSPKLQLRRPATLGGANVHRKLNAGLSYDPCFLNYCSSSSSSTGLNYTELMKCSHMIVLPSIIH